ncbi:putative nuclear pore complex protein Nup214 [Daphnia sinensis]|uniref:Nuclear pore complex protein Nup214 n=1 Tax=Daphnia sinensis TaxID=1820382 RepID=A0AAD5LDH0_9CRUS|nr:putative nuclear pore complex protein Nup214 [Daphnia sinensis]
MANVPDPVEVLDFKLKQLCRFRVTTKKYDVQDNSSLLATSHLFGLVFVGAPDKLVVIKVADLVQIDHATSKKSEISSFPSKEILLPSKPIFVALSCDNLTLMVCLQMSGCPVGWMYDVRGFARQAGEWSPFQEVRLSSTDGITVSDCAWNPTVPGLVAVSLSNGSLVAVEINNTQFSINSLPSNTQAQAISWSPKGKQLVVARPGKLVQYKPDLKEAKTIAFSGSDVHMTTPIACGLQWLSTSQFLVTFIDQDDPNSRPHLHIVNVQKSGATTFIDYDDVCYGSPSGRPHKYLTLSIPSWNVLLASSANAIEIAVLGQTGGGDAEHPEWRQWTLEGEWRAELPLDENTETNPMGMAIDTTSQTPISWDDNQTLPPAPILFVLSTHGLLCPFHIINQKNATPVNQAPQELSVIGERPGRSGIGLKPAPLAASTPLPSAPKVALPRTNLGERFSTFAGAPSLTVPTTAQSVSGPAVLDKVFGNKPLQPSVPSATTAKVASQPAPVVAPVKAEATPVVSSTVKVASQTMAAEQPNIQASVDAATAILRDEVVKFVQDLEEFKARSSTLKVTVASEEDKQRLLKLTSDLSAFGVDLVDTTKVQDEEVRGLCTDLVEVAALLEDARVRHARRKNPRYSHLLKLRPLDPGNRRKMDDIERLHIHIEQQLVEASRCLDSISRERTRDNSRKVEIPITQVIYEAIRNNAKVISQLKSRVERIIAQSKEQQLKIAGAAFEALRPKGADDSSKWESELAVLADSLLTSSIKGEAGIHAPHPVIPQVSPDKQAMLRSVLAKRPVARIRAVRPESVAESRLLSNLSGFMHKEDKNASASDSVISQASSKSSVSNARDATLSSPVEIKPQLPKLGPATIGSNAVTPQAPTRAPLAKYAPQPAPEVEDVTPPSSPVNLDQKAKDIGTTLMMSSFSLPSRITTTTVAGEKPTSKLTDVKPTVSLPTSLPPPYEPKPTFASIPTSLPSLSFGTPKQTPQPSGLGSTSLFGKSSFASPFNAAPTPSTTPANAPPKATAESTSSFAALSTPAVPATVQSQQTKSFSTPSFGLAFPPVTSTSAPSPAPLSAKPAEQVPSLKTSFSFNSLAAAVGAAPTPTSTVVTTSTVQAAGALPNFTFSSTPATTTTASPTIATTTTAPLSFATPQSSSSISTSSSDGLTSAVKPTAAPTNFSFNLAKVPSSSNVTAPAAAPFTFNLSGAGLATTSATPIAFSAPSSTAVAGSLFSLTPTTKTPTAFGVVSTVAPATTPSSSLFGQTPAVSATAISAPVVSSLFGQSATPTAAPNTSATGVTPLFGQGQPANSLATGVPVTQPAFGLAVTTTSATSSTPAPAVTTIFGQPTTTSQNTGTLFGQPSNPPAGLFSSSFGQGTFGQSTSTTSTTANAPLFGQSAFGKPAQALPQTSVAPSVQSFGSPPVFGQSSGAATGMSAGSVFGQGATATTTPIKPLFGASAFGQAPANAAATASSPSQGFGANMFGNMGLGGTPSAANANRNAFGGGTVFGSAAPSGQGAFGTPAGSSSFGAQAATPSAAPSFGSPSQPSFGGFGQTQTQPAFGGAATFGGSPLFGSKPTFGGGPTFGSPVSSIAAPKQEAGFGAFAASNNVPTFGVLASSGPTFEALASSSNTQPAFGGAAFPSTNPPSFGGGSSFSSWR